MSQEVTLLLQRVSTGDATAGQELLPLLYSELRAIAGRQFRSQRSDHTLQPTALVHEAFVKMLGSSSAGWNNRKHFVAIAATAMRQILVNHARDRSAQKRGGHDKPVALVEAAEPSRLAPAAVDVLSLNEALEKLQDVDARKHRIVELRFFGGLSVEEIADVLEVSKTTVESEWRATRAWLARNMKDWQPQ